MFSDLIRGKRAERRMSQDSFAQLIGLNSLTYRRKESNSIPFTGDDVAKAVSTVSISKEDFISAMLGDNIRFDAHDMVVVCKAFDFSLDEFNQIFFDGELPIGKMMFHMKQIS